MRAQSRNRDTTTRSDLLDVVNVGPAVVRHLARVGVTSRAQLVGRDPVELYQRLSAVDGAPADPCLLDTFMSAVDQADGGPARPWWHYTAERKQRYSGLFTPNGRFNDSVARSRR